MGKDKLTVLVLFLLVVGAAVAVRYLYQRRSDAAIEPPAIQPSQAGEFRGICLQIHNSRPATPYETFVDEIATTGANTVKIVVNAYQENAESTSIFIEARKTPPYDKMVALCQHARRRGLRVVLMPILLLKNPRAGEWRGTIRPSNWDDWWEDYSSYVLYYARVARDAKADVFLIGSELISTETHTDRWRKLIRQVRKIYPGRLSYSSNWDHYEVVKFWSDLDLIGMTTYYDLAGDEKPTLANILAAWKPIKKRILAWRKTIDRPILFTEVGWPNLITAAKYPWDYTRLPATPDPQQQAACFEAFFRTWFHEESVAGYLVWEWRNSMPEEEPSKEELLRDTGYCPRGKPAMDVIRTYFRKPSPWATSQPATQPAGGTSAAAASP